MNKHHLTSKLQDRHKVKRPRGVIDRDQELIIGTVKSMSSRRSMPGQWSEPGEQARGRTSGRKEVTAVECFSIALTSRMSLS
jgi:hypothetical protein